MSFHNKSLLYTTATNKDFTNPLIFIKHDWSFFNYKTGEIVLCTVQYFLSFISSKRKQSIAVSIQRFAWNEFVLKYLYYVQSHYVQLNQSAKTWALTHPRFFFEVFTFFSMKSFKHLNSENFQFSTSFEANLPFFCTLAWCEYHVSLCNKSTK